MERFGHRRLCKVIHETFGLDAQAPYSGSVFDLKNGCWEKEEAPVRIKKPETRAQDAIQGLKAIRPLPDFWRPASVC